MPYSICTLFEGHYHYGVAALTNSLYKKGFRGSIYAGYRGKLPEWSNRAKETTSFQWKGSKTLEVADGLQIHFLPVDTDYHFANYKPEYMIQLFEGPASDAEGLVYFDPDIVVKCNWDFYETWLSFGVALVHELLYNDMPASNPIRRQWEQLIAESNRSITSDINSYINSGFCGIPKNCVQFLSVWSEFIELAISKYGFNKGRFRGFQLGHVFYNGDQDALNIAAMCSGCPISEIGPEGMDFVVGGFTMSHATYRPKPWKKNFLRSVFNGIPPNAIELSYWKNVEYPIAPYKNRNRVVFKIYCFKIASFIGRFYRRY